MTLGRVAAGAGTLRPLGAARAAVVLIGLSLATSPAAGGPRARRFPALPGSARPSSRVPDRRSRGARRRPPGGVSSRFQASKAATSAPRVEAAGAREIARRRRRTASAVASWQSFCSASTTRASDQPRSCRGIAPGDTAGQRTPCGGVDAALGPVERLLAAGRRCRRGAPPGIRRRAPAATLRLRRAAARRSAHVLAAAANRRPPRRRACAEQSRKRESPAGSSSVFRRHSPPRGSCARPGERRRPCRGRAPRSWWRKAIAAADRLDADVLARLCLLDSRSVVLARVAGPAERLAQ